MHHLFLPITSFTAFVLGMVYFIQTWSVIRGRIRGQIILGDGDDRSFKKRVRGHSNMAEQAPIFLILLLLAEIQGCVTPKSLAIVAGVFMVGRIIHALYFLDLGLHHRFRLVGMTLTLLAQLLALLTTVCTLSGGTLLS
jgi:uncharacterized membrane protein YecN with MAPEG domain